MHWRFLSFILLCGVLAGLASSCTFFQASQQDADPQAQIAVLEAALARHPDEAHLLRDLGILYLRTQQADKALSTLERARARLGDDLETLFHYGLALEANARFEEALAIYAQYTTSNRRSPYRRKMAGRYTWLSRQRIQEDIRARLADETAYAQTPPRTLAVFPFTYSGGDPQYAPLGRGLAEMLTVDLSHVQSLDVLERVRVQVLIEEALLATGTNPVVDPATAPRAGRLLGARRLVAGTYGVLPGDRLRLDATAHTLNAESINLDSRSDALANFFVLEKDLVFSLLDQLGIVPTPAEREAIERVPTRNMQAFLAYCRGLEAEDAGRYDAATQHFREAQALDPAFEQAAQEAEWSDALRDADGTPEMIAGVPAPATRTPMDDLMRGRQERLNDTVGAGFVPGQDDRDPAVEATAAGVVRLPDPPTTPARGN